MFIDVSDDHVHVSMVFWNNLHYMHSYVIQYWILLECLQIIGKNIVTILNKLHVVFRTFNTS